MSPSSRLSRFSAALRQVAFAPMIVLAAFAISHPGHAAETVKICAVLPTTGPNAAVGIGMMNSMQLAIRRINESGKMGDLRLELLAMDDRSQPSEGVNAVLKAASDPAVLACAAHWNSPVAIATRDVFHRNGLANLNPCAINWRVTAEQKGDEIFRIAPPDRWQLAMAAKFPFDKMGKKTFFLIDDSTNYGKSLVQSFEEDATKAGGTMIGSDSISVGEKDFTAVLTKAKRLKPDVVFFGGVTNEAALLRTQMVKLEFETFYYTGSGTMTPTYVDIAGPAADGTYAFFYGVPYDQTPGGNEFVKAYKAAKYDKPYETYGLIAYASIEVLGQAIKSAKDAGTLTRKGVIDQLKRGEFASALGPISFPSPGDAKERVLAFYEVKNGNWTLVYTSDPDGVISKSKMETVWALPWQ
jgi:branched-chain amino acid transport system substrate-binding protein